MNTSRNAVIRTLSMVLEAESAPRRTFPYGRKPSELSFLRLFNLRALLSSSFADELGPALHALHSIGVIGFQAGRTGSWRSFMWPELESGQPSSNCSRCKPIRSSSKSTFHLSSRNYVSIVSSSLPGCFPQYWQVNLVTLENVAAAEGNRLSRHCNRTLVNAMTSGIRIRWRTDWMNGSSRSGPVGSNRSSHTMVSIGSTILAESFHSMISARATVATLIGCQLRFAPTLDAEAMGSGRLACCSCRWLLRLCSCLVHGRCSLEGSRKTLLTRTVWAVLGSEECKALDEVMTREFPLSIAYDLQRSGPVRITFIPEGARRESTC